MKNSDVRLLVLDDEEGMCKLLKSILTAEGYDVITSTSPLKSLEMVRNEKFDVVIVDINMPEMNGLEFLKQATEIRPELYFIMITAYGSIENAVDAMKFGAFDYITKPFQGDEIRIAVRQALDHIKLVDENIRLKREIELLQNPGGLNVISRRMQEILAFCRKVSDSQLSVLITGESGTGKEVIAKYIHTISDRKDQPFVPVQCSLLPVNLLESELFGFKKGSFTGAGDSRAGLFEQADNGIIFLDEIGDIGIDIQGKLLRFLQDREIRRIGDSKSMVLNVRMISATNKNLEELIKKKEFRDDLYFRLKVLAIHIPPLRERKEDIPFLLNSFLVEINNSRKEPVEIENECVNYLMKYDWPGNVRELKNCIESASALCENNVIRRGDISSILTVTQDPLSEINMNFRDSKARVIEEFERKYLSGMLEKNMGNIAAAAREAEIDRKNFWQMVQKYNIEPEEYKK
ncbi:MAG TPA: sigma-54 dependent transcriptional regulator [Spirochaetota bacterium]|nr:sigma-54 dependent transcriptional regulator [Spirochaetota bacterium]HPS87626.1 sigma-54 dependent transcriptional regulator [Spirochaetota bacterium]